MKKLIAILAVFALIFGFAACRGNENNAETTAAPNDAQTTQAAAETTKFAEVAGKTIMLKKTDSADFVEINTDSQNLGSTIMVHKFFASQEAFDAAKAKGDYDSLTLVTAIDANREIIYSDSQSVKGMAYDEILSKAENAEGYVIIPAE